MACGRSTGCQAAHANYGKGERMKVCDSLTFPFALTATASTIRAAYRNKSAERREVAYVYRTRDALSACGLWSPAVEEAFQRAS